MLGILTKLRTFSLSFYIFVVVVVYAPFWHTIHIFISSGSGDAAIVVVIVVVGVHFRSSSFNT